MDGRRSLAEEYHRLTKYTEENVRAGPVLDWSRRPAQCKEIVASCRIPMRAYLPFRTEEEGAASHRAPLTPAVGGTGPGIAELSRMLFFAYGVTGLIRYPDGNNQVLRAAPSAGALYPTEIYLACRDLPGIDAGLYNYFVPGHELVRLWEGDQLDAIGAACGGDRRLADAPCFLVFTAVYWRSAWRYRERGYRRVLLDTGHALANLAAYAPHEGCRADPLTGFCDGAMNGLFFFDDSVEAVIACAPVLPASGPAPAATPWASSPCPAQELDAALIEEERELSQSATVKVHRAAYCDAPAPVPTPASREPPVTARSLPLEAPLGIQERLPQAILHRRSARHYEREPIDLGALGKALGFAFGRSPAPGGERLAVLPARRAGLLHAHLAVLRVEGLECGIYAVEGAGEALRPVAMGSVEAAVHRTSLGQEIARDAAAVLILAAPARDAVAAFGDRAYRNLHLEAGLAGERFQLAAAVLGLGACGIGGFLDDDAARLAERTGEDWVLYLITIGRE